MKKCLIFLSLLTAMIFYSCEENEPLVDLNANENLSFSGIFESINSNNISGTVILNISNRYYECLTNLPYGHSAGKLETDETRINFIDTLFFVIPAMYGPSHVLSGEYHYKFDGENLKIWKEKNVGSIEYHLKIIKPNRA